MWTGEFSRQNKYEYNSYIRSKYYDVIYYKALFKLYGGIV